MFSDKKKTCKIFIYLYIGSFNIKNKLLPKLNGIFMSNKYNVCEIFIQLLCKNIDI